ncbi:hypothetical protein, partial [Endozoicomonas sp. ONNA2]|uniref:hypothetical protein n=1 Tax=Endozoicomonas sp. ONNA2 TaxID=2828741 RepID=UPI0021478349
KFCKKMAPLVPRACRTIKQGTGAPTPTGTTHPVPGTNRTFTGPASADTPTTVTMLPGNTTLPGYDFTPSATPGAPISLAAILCIAIGSGVVLLAGAAVACCCYHRRQRSGADSLTSTGRTSPDDDSQSMSEVVSPYWPDKTTPDFSKHHQPLWPGHEKITEHSFSMNNIGTEPDQTLYFNQPDWAESNQSIDPLLLAEQERIESWYSNSITNIEQEPDQSVLLNELRMRDNFTDMW